MPRSPMLLSGRVSVPLAEADGPLKLPPKKLGKSQIMALAQKKNMGDRHGIWIKETTLQRPISIQREADRTVMTWLKMHSTGCASAVFYFLFDASDQIVMRCYHSGVEWCKLRNCNCKIFKDTSVHYWEKNTVWCHIWLNVRMFPQYVIIVVEQVTFRHPGHINAEILNFTKEQLAG